MMSYDASWRALLSPAEAPTVFDEARPPSDLLLATELARLAYLPVERDAAAQERLASDLAKAGIANTEWHASEETGAFAYCCTRERDGAAFVVFRGTEPKDYQDWAINLTVMPVPWGTGHAHSGFAKAAASLELRLAEWVRKSERTALRFYGHSLGAAMAMLLAPMLGATEVVTIGCPRTSDAQFLASLPGQVTRIVNCSDLVTNLPLEGPRFTHGGALVYIDREGQAHDSPSGAFMGVDRTLAQGLPGRLLFDHSPINYVRVFA